MESTPRHSFRHSRTSIQVAVAALMLLGAGQAQAATKIQHGVVFLNATGWPEFVAEAKGYFKEQDLDVETIATRSSSNTIQQLAAGGLNISSSGMPDHLRGAAQGAPTKMFLNQIGTPPYAVYAKSSIKSVKELKGKKVIIGGPKDVTRYYIETLFEKEGLEPGSYDYIYAGSTANRFAALKSGGVDAAILLPPFSFRAQQEGFTNLGDIQTVLSDFPFTVFSYNTNWAKTNRRALVGYSAALLKAKQWLYDLNNRQEAAQILSKATKFSIEDSLANYDYFIKDLKAVSRDGLISEDSYKKMMNVLVGWGDVKPPVPPFSQFYDATISADAEKSLKK